MPGQCLTCRVGHCKSCLRRRNDDDIDFATISRRDAVRSDNDIVAAQREIRRITGYRPSNGIAVAAGHAQRGDDCPRRRVASLGGSSGVNTIASGTWIVTNNVGVALPAKVEEAAAAIS